MRRLVPILAAVAAFGLTSRAIAAEMTVDASRSVFAIATHKAGFASALAHDHLIVEPRPEVKLDFDSARPAETHLVFTAKASDLEADANDRRKALGPRLVELEIYREPLPEVSESHRKKVFDAAIGAGQLDAAHFPEIRAEVVSAKKRDGAAAPGGLDWTARVRVTVHGKTVEREVAARYRETGGAIEIEALGRFAFKEFGIEPYSSFAGAVRNEDAFEIYVFLVATPRN